MFAFIVCAVVSASNSFPINEYVIISKWSEPESMFHLDRGTFRLKEIPEKIFKPTDKNVAKIINTKTAFQIKFYDGSLYKKRGDPGVIGADFDINDPGFLFDIIPHRDGGYSFKARGTCLEVRSKINSIEGSYINGQPCKSYSENQRFAIERAEMEIKECHIPSINVFIHKDHVARGHHGYFEDVYPGKSLI